MKRALINVWIVLLIVGGCLLFQRNRPPNVMLVVLDAVRADALSSYGYERETTPFIDTLASKGLVYSRAYSPSSWTMPSHASIFTGQTPYEHGCHHVHAYLVDRHNTLAEALRDRGYVTAAFNANPVISKDNNLLQGFETIDEVWRTHDPSKLDYRGSEYTNEQVKAWIARTKEPWFVFINYMDAHNPYWPPVEYRNRYLRGDLGPIASLANINNMSVLSGKLKLAPGDYRQLRNLYDGSISYLDYIVSDLMSAVNKRTTLVIITSDHGEAFGEHGHFTHNSLLYRELLHVPLIFYGKNINEPMIDDGLVSIKDIYRAILEASPYNLSSGSPVMAFHYPSLTNRWINKHKSTGFSLIDGRMHYIAFQKELPEVYDDEGELINLCPSSISPLTVQKVINDQLRNIDAFVERDEDLKSDDSLQDEFRLAKLRTLGYSGGEVAPNISAHAEVHLNRGVAFARIGRFDLALKEMQKAQKTQPYNKRVNQVLLAIRNKVGK